MNVQLVFIYSNVKYYENENYLNIFSDVKKGRKAFLIKIESDDKI